MSPASQTLIKCVVNYIYTESVRDSQTLSSKKYLSPFNPFILPSFLQATGSGFPSMSKTLASHPTGNRK